MAKTIVDKFKLGLTECPLVSFDDRPNEVFIEVQLPGEKKPYETDDDRLVYIKYYTPPEDRIGEALRILDFRASQFSRLAETDLRVPKTIYDQEGNHITDPKKVIDLVLASRKEGLAGDPNDRYAQSQVAGTIVVKIVLSAREAIAAVQEDRITSARTTYDRNREFKIVTPIMKPTFALMNELNDFLLKGAVKLRDGNKVDIDGVLKALVGEFIKPALHPNEFINNQDYSKNRSKILQIKSIEDLMLSLTQESKHFKEIAPDIRSFIGAAVKLAGYSESDLKYDELSRDTKKKADKIITKITSILTDIPKKELTREDKLVANDIKDHAKALILDVLDQGSKLVSIHLLRSMVEVERLSAKLRKIIKSNQFFDGIDELLEKFSDVAEKNIENFLTDGEPKANLEKYLLKAKDKLLDKISKLVITQSCPTDIATNLRKILEILNSGTNAMYALATPDMNALMDAAKNDAQLPETETEKLNVVKARLAEAEPLLALSRQTRIIPTTTEPLLSPDRDGKIVGKEPTPSSSWGCIAWPVTVPLGAVSWLMKRAIGKSGGHDGLDPGTKSTGPRSK